MGRYAFGHWTPDLPSLVNGSKSGLIQAKNMLPKTGGYGPLRTLANLSGGAALAKRPRGSIGGTDEVDETFLFSSTDVALYRRGESSMDDVSVSGGYVLGTNHRWSLARFGNSIFAATINHTLQYRAISGSGLFAPVAAFAPRAKHIETVGNFLMAGNLVDAEGGILPDSIRWCAIDNPLNWPAFGSDAAVQVQADRRPLEGNGGAVQDIVAGAEIGIVFQERAIHRLDYVSGQDIFQGNRVEAGNGMLIPYSGVAYERNVFYIAEDGFRVFDYVTSHPIGKSRVSAEFLADVDPLYLDRVEVVRDPDRTVIWIAYPGVGNTSGRPNRLILYDYRLDQFTHAAIDLEGLIESATSVVASIDAPATAGDPDDVDAAADLDSYDDAQGVSGPDGTIGASRLGAFDTSFIASDLTGAYLEGLIETGDIEGVPDRLFWLDEVRPLVSGRKAEIAVSGRDRLEEEVVYGPYLPTDQDGTISFRSDARYHRFRIKLLPGWDDAVGMDIYGTASGER